MEPKVLVFCADSRNSGAKTKVVWCASVIPLLSHQLSADPVDTLARELKVSVVGKATHLDHGFGRLAVGLRAAWGSRQGDRPEVRSDLVGQGHLEGLAKGRPSADPSLVNSSHSVSSWVSRSGGEGGMVRQKKREKQVLV